MSEFEGEFFKRFEFSSEDLKRYLESAFHDLEIATRDPFPEVRFTYSYQALIKGGIALVAKALSMKVRSVPGHHVKILSKISEILDDLDILTIGNAMRMKRNTDLYSGGKPITEKEASDYFEFVQGVLKKIKIKMSKT